MWVTVIYVELQPFLLGSNLLAEDSMIGRPLLVESFPPACLTSAYYPSAATQSIETSNYKEERTLLSVPAKAKNPSGVRIPIIILVFF